MAYRLLFALLSLVGLSAALWAQGVVVNKNVNLRPTASTDEPSKRLLKPPEKLTLVTDIKQNGFYHVTTSQNEDGWVWAKNVAIIAGVNSFTSQVGGAGRLPLAAKDTLEPGKYAMHDPACQPWGDEPPAEDGGLRNVAKRWIAKDTTPIALIPSNFKQLQADTDKDAAKHKHNRDALVVTGRHAGAQVVSEGNRVSVSGFLSRAQDGAPVESVNCKIGKTTKDGRDIHVNIGPEANGDEYAGIVVEFIPQLPVGDWPVPARAKAKAALQKVMAAKLRVLAIGSLTYDNEHLINADKLHPKGGQPARMSLWEIHPVLEFYVCPKGKMCDPAAAGGNWRTLDKWAAENPQ